MKFDLKCCLDRCSVAESYHVKSFTVTAGPAIALSAILCLQDKQKYKLCLGHEEDSHIKCVICTFQTKKILSPRLWPDVKT